MSLNKPRLSPTAVMAVAVLAASGLVCGGEEVENGDLWGSIAESDGALAGTQGRIETCDDAMDNLMRVERGLRGEISEECSHRVIRCVQDGSTCDDVGCAGEDFAEARETFRNTCVWELRG